MLDVYLYTYHETGDLQNVETPHELTRLMMLMWLRSMRLRFSKLPMPLMLTRLRTPKPLMPLRTRPMSQQSAKADKRAKFLSQGKANKPTRPLIGERVAKANKPKRLRPTMLLRLTRPMMTKPKLTKLRPLKPPMPTMMMRSTIPTIPMRPTRPTRPSRPTRPMRPMRPMRRPKRPTRPIRPLSPLRPKRPMRPMRLRPMKLIRPC